MIIYKLPEIVLLCFINMCIEKFTYLSFRIKNEVEK